VRYSRRLSTNPAPAQAREVVGDLRLRLAGELDELADRALAVGKQLENPQSRPIAETEEVLRDDIGRHRLLRQLERGRLEGAHWSSSSSAAPSISCGSQQRGEHVHGRGLAGAVWPEQAEDLARPHRERDPGDGNDPATGRVERLGEPVDFDHQVRSTKR
jgi:hypothetical protein